MGILNQIFEDKPILKWLNHKNLYWLGLATICCGLGWSNALMSIGQFILAGNWILELNFKQKLQRLLTHKTAWVLLSIFLLHLIGLLWSEDLPYAWKDLRIKLPLFILPIIIGTSASLEAKEWRNLIIVYTGTLFILTLASLVKYIGLFGYDFVDKRELSIRISHIRYGLNLSLAALLLFHYRALFAARTHFLLYALVLWFAFCLFLYSLFTGFLILIPLGFLLALKEITTRYQSANTKAIIGITTIAIVVFISFTVRSIYNDFNTTPVLNYNQHSTKASYTEGGELYWSDFKDKRQENGVYVRRFIAWKEIEREWNKRSKINFWQQDLKGQTLDQTLNRFLSSKGLKKDSAGIAQLTNQEIKAIEKGVANQYFLTHNSIQNRVFKTLFELNEYKRTGIADGFSLAQRFEYWKTALSIIRTNFWTGVGTGDIQIAFEKQYKLENSKLAEKYRRRAHNQYLTIFATFGIIGLILFLNSLIYPLFRREHTAFYPFFLALICLSFLSEDTLETQAGVSLFAFFNSLFVLGFAHSQPKTSL